MTGSSQLLHFSCAQANGAKSHLFSKANCHLGWNDITPPPPPPNPRTILPLSPSLMSCSRVRRRLLLFWMNVHGTGEKLQLHPASLDRRASRGPSVLSSQQQQKKEINKEKKHIKSALAAHFSSFHIRAAGAHRQKLNICCCPCCSQGRRLWCRFNLAGFRRRSG